MIDLLFKNADQEQKRKVKPLLKSSGTAINYKATGNITDVDEKGFYYEGYWSSFGNLDSYKDEIVKGAYSNTIDLWGPDGENRIFLLRQHSAINLLGLPSFLKEDDFGLLAGSTIVPTTLGIDTIKLLQAKVLKEHSIGYEVIRSEEVRNEQGDLIKTKLLEIKLWEGSLVTHGADRFTPVTSIKSYVKTANELKERYSNLMSAIKNEYWHTDIAPKMILLELKLMQPAMDALDKFEFKCDINGIDKKQLDDLAKKEELTDLNVIQELKGLAIDNTGSEKTESFEDILKELETELAAIEIGEKAVDSFSLSEDELDKLLGEI